MLKSILSCLLLGALGQTQALTWVPRNRATTPPPRTGHAMAYDAARQTVVLFGGRSPTSHLLLRDTWLWDGGTWTQRFPATVPAEREDNVMAYDSARGRVVMFGSLRGSSENEIWEWDGNDWFHPTPVTTPPSRNNAALAFDAARGRVMMCGGGAQGGFDTWEWDGIDWRQRLPIQSPPSRWAHALTYDSVRGRVVLFGGQGGPSFTTFLSDTWEWDGNNWTQRTPTASPQARFFAAFAFDAPRSRTVLFGGYNGVTALSDTWEWDGTAWVQASPSFSPPAQYNNPMAFDVARGRAVLLDGRAAATWDYPNQGSASYSTFGGGCAGSAGTPTLQALGTSLPWIGERFTLLFNNVPPGRPIFVFVGGSNTTWNGQFPLPLDLTGAGMTGCWLLVTGDFIGVAQPIVNFVPWHLDICQCPELLGAQFYNQGFVYDPPANPMGMTSTNGGGGVIGIR